ncbi:Alkaline ceramidase 3 [Desmophyllum pertusum]|uniref:Alkaline ceramidase n=1 Tax=Desmophyllum pertusum TaxID=174260 RepID=A0A9X0A3C1_9CNID|nr:Alkaline ceramidase 3 [Desmophyllum pertusum]
MAPLSTSASGEGFWGEATSTIDWCEENYAVTAYLAEFWNTLSNWLFLIPPLFGAFLTWENKLERRYTLAFLSLCVVGIGSVCFHATLLYEMQLLDELPMIYGTCVLIFSIWHCSYRPRNHNITLTLVLIVCCAMVTLVYLTVVNPLIFQWAYSFQVAALVLQSIMACRKHKGSKRLLTISLSSFAIGFIFWTIDNNYCSYVRDVRNALFPPIRPFTQLHAIWHTLAAIGSYYHILFSIDLRLRCLGRPTNLKLFWEWLPFVYPSKDSSAYDILPTVNHNAAIFLLLFGLIMKLLK